MEIIKIPKKEGIIDRTTGKALNRKLRVAAYARVSTMGAEQLNSYESQKKYYYEKINNNPEWQYVDIYADEGISGTTDYRRASFMKMIQDALSGKIDLILTKSISRFGRNTMDVLKNVRLLRDNNVAVLFEENNLNTLDTKTSEMLLTTLSAVAQQESENIIWLVYGNKAFNPCCGKVINITERQLEQLHLVSRDDSIGDVSR